MEDSLRGADRAPFASFIGRRCRFVYKDDLGQGRVREGIFKACESGLLVIEQRAPYPDIIINSKDVVRIEVLG